MRLVRRIALNGGKRPGGREDGAQINTVPHGNHDTHRDSSVSTGRNEAAWGNASGNGAARLPQAPTGRNSYSALSGLRWFRLIPATWGVGLGCFIALRWGSITCSGWRSPCRTLFGSTPTRQQKAFAGGQVLIRRSAWRRHFLRTAVPRRPAMGGSRGVCGSERKAIH
jgi:hypothetical protein